MGSGQRAYFGFGGLWRLVHPGRFALQGWGEYAWERSVRVYVVFVVRSVLMDGSEDSGEVICVRS